MAELGKTRKSNFDRQEWGAISPRGPIVLALLSVLLAAGIETRQPPEISVNAPIEKGKILRALSIPGSRPEDKRAFIEEVERRGVDFYVSSEVEAELRRAGAWQELVDALRSHYRASVPPEEVRPAMSRPPFLRLTVKQIPKAASQSAPEGARLQPEPTPSRSSSLIYGVLIQGARAEMARNNTARAAEFLQQAVVADSSSPAAHEMLGQLGLYYSRDLPAAEKSMREAIGRGGKAVFRVRLLGKTQGEFSDGILTVTQTVLNFEADDKTRRFSSAGTSGVTVELTESSDGSFVVILATPGRAVERYALTPSSKSREEASLIVKLIQSR